MLLLDMVDIRPLFLHRKVAFIQYEQFSNSLSTHSTDLCGEGVDFKIKYQRSVYIYTPREENVSMPLVRFSPDSLNYLMISCTV